MKRKRARRGGSQQRIKKRRPRRHTRGFVERIRAVEADFKVGHLEKKLSAVEQDRRQRPIRNAAQCAVFVSHSPRHVVVFMFV